MTDQERMLLQFHLNTALSAIIDGRLVDLIKKLGEDKTPEMRMEIALLKKIYEKFLEAKPNVEKLHQRGRQIANAKTN